MCYGVFVCVRVCFECPLNSKNVPKDLSKQSSTHSIAAQAHSSG